MILYSKCAGVEIKRGPRDGRSTPRRRFFKNIALVFVIFFFQADNGWSGSSLYNQWVYSGYNFFVGLLPFYMGFFGYVVAPSYSFEAPVVGMIRRRRR